MGDEMQIKTQLPDPMRLLAWSMGLVLTIGVYVWRGEVAMREQMQQAQQKDHEEIAALKTQLLVQGTSGQTISQAIVELRDDMKELRKEFRPLLEDRRRR